MNTLSPSVASEVSSAPGGVIIGSDSPTVSSQIGGQSSGAAGNFQSAIDKACAGTQPANSKPDGANAWVANQNNPRCEVDSASQAGLNDLELASNDGKVGLTKGGGSKTKSTNAASEDKKTSLMTEGDASVAMTGAMMLMFSSIQSAPPVQPQLQPAKQGGAAVETSLASSEDGTISRRVDASSIGSTVLTSNDSTGFVDAGVSPRTSSSSKAEKVAKPSVQAEANANPSVDGEKTVKPSSTSVQKNASANSSQAGLPANGETLAASITRSVSAAQEAAVAQPPSIAAQSANIASFASDAAAVYAGYNGKPADEINRTNASQTSIHQRITSDSSESSEAEKTTGTGIALSQERMKNSEQKNNSAGDADQKPQREVRKGEAASGIRGSAKASVSLKRSDAEGAGGTISSSQARNIPDATPLLSSAPLADSKAAARVEHISQMVGREVVLVKQSGAKELAVSLRVDSKTELFLKVTNTDGRIQAVLSCERGSADAMNKHWPELQASLALQNIQLLPPANAPVQPLNQPDGSASGFHQPGNSSSQQGFQERQQAAGNPFGNGFEESKPGASNSKTKQSGSKNVQPQGWESWA